MKPLVRPLSSDTSAVLIGVDTNILIRLLIRDHEAQFDKCVDLVNSAATQGALAVNPLVLTELVWFLEKRATLTIEQARSLVRDLMNTSEFVVLDRLSFGDWQSWFDQMHVGFFDVVIASSNKQNGCEFTYTFDKKAAQNVPGMKLLA